jgi:hypothetical protein
MSQGSNGEGSDSSVEEPTVTLAKICMIDGNGKIDDWDGKEPNGKRLFVYAHIGYTTYSSYMPRNKGYSYNPDFTNMRAGPYDPAGASFLHCSNGSIILPLMQGAHHDIGPLQSNCRIYQDNDTTTFWYKLCDDPYGHDNAISTNVHDRIRPIRLSEIGNPCSIDKKYTPFCGYLPGECLFLFKRECNQTYKPLKGNTLKGISKNTKKRNLSRSLRRGGGKTRRKFKVKKRRNRRIRNTMKRRKTAVKRRKGRK